MLNQQTKKTHNQRKAMTQRHRLCESLEHERQLLIHRVAEQSRIVREHTTSRKDRDGYDTDLRRSSFMRETRRLRAYTGRLEFLTNKIQRMKY